jgi:DNA mismatch repair ATPase MutS
VATLDCVISLAMVARSYNWVKPKLIDAAVIDVDAGRHPIGELLSSSPFVPNSIRSGGAQTKVKVLAGPNASGKSVYLKQVRYLCGYGIPFTKRMPEIGTVSVQIPYR